MQVATAGDNQQDTQTSLTCKAFNASSFPGLTGCLRCHKQCRQPIRHGNENAFNVEKVTITQHAQLLRQSGQISSRQRDDIE